MTDATKTIDLTVNTAGAIRMAMLMTHYRSPLELGTQTETGT